MSILRIRRSQLISKHGVGSIYPGTDGISRITAGLDYWFKHENSDNNLNVKVNDFKIKEWRLQKRLGVSHFRAPPDYRKFEYHLQGQKNLDLKIPFLRFPTWHRCANPKCNMLSRSSNALTAKKMWECQKKPKENKGKVCGGTLIQVPFVIFCQSGHIEDFPWNEWVHADHAPSCDGRSLKYEKQKYKSGLDSIAITCLSCLKKRNLKNITSSSKNNSTVLTDTLEKDYKFKCRGAKTWLGEGKFEECHHPVRASLRSASNLYYSKILSSIFLPSVDDDILNEIIETLRGNSEIDTYISNARDFSSSNEQIFIKVLEKFPYELKNYSKENIRKALDFLIAKETDDGSHSLIINGDDLYDKEIPFRRLEYNRLLSNDSSEELIINKKNIHDYTKNFLEYFSSISLVKKLRETRVLYGFSRLFPDANKDKDIFSMRNMLRDRPLGISDDWLPAVKVYGEGIFLELREDKISKWEEQDLVKSHIQKIQSNLDMLTEKRKLKSRIISPRFILLHTLSHILINKFIYESGYHSASLRERIYCSTNPNGKMSGILIYTADGDSEGTMGGLVSMGEAGIIDNVFLNAIENARWCAADPVCSEIGKRDGQGLEKINLAACHNCCLLAETSCEEFNRLLDRGVLTDKELGFFKNLNNSK